MSGTDTRFAWYTAPILPQHVAPIRCLPVQSRSEFAQVERPARAFSALDQQKKLYDDLRLVPKDGGACVCLLHILRVFLCLVFNHQRLRMQLSCVGY